MVLYCLFWCQSFGDVSPYVCSLYFEFGLGCRAATFWEIVARLVGHLFPLSFVYLYFLFIYQFGFESGVQLLIAQIPVHCFSFTLTKQLRPQLTHLIIHAKNWPK